MEKFRRFSLLPFPQYFKNNELTLNLVVLPRNQNPLRNAIEGQEPIVSVAPAFADAQLSFDAKIITRLDAFPNTLNADFTRNLVTTPPVNARALFTQLATLFDIKPLDSLNIDITSLADAARSQELSVKKYLPLTYRAAFNFTTVRTPNARTDDMYQCAVRDGGKTPGFQRSPDTVNWGNVFAYALRQPLLGEQLGIIYKTKLQIQPGDFPEGGWLYIDLAAGSDYFQQQQEVDEYNKTKPAKEAFAKRYAARIPALKPGGKRQVFAPLLFPVLFKANAADPDPVPEGKLDQIQIEASEYDDGFAKIVHAHQPPSRNLLEEKNNGAHPVKDVGIRLGWDDEQILIWYMRQMVNDPDIGKRLDLPLGVFGYAVDVQDVTAAPGTWNTLNHVKSRFPLALGNAPEFEIGKFDDELPYQVYPSQIDGNMSNAFWLPMYFGNWTGHSMVLPDEEAALVYQTTRADDPDHTVKQDPELPVPVGAQRTTDPEYPNKITGTGSKGPAKNDLNKQYEPIGIGAELQYGHQYEFRVRLRDLSGGGAPFLPDVEPINDSPAQNPKCRFRRFVAPNQVRTDTPFTPNTDSPLHLTGLKLRRPLLGYPAVKYTGKYVDAVARLKDASYAMVGKEAFGIPDPDVDRVRITVEIQTLKMDNLGSISGKENYVVLYQTDRKFSPILTEDDYDNVLDIPIDYKDCKILHTGDATDLKNDLGVDDIDALTGLVLPKARTIRLTLRAVCEEKVDEASYYGTPANENHPDMDMRYGHTSQVWVYQPSKDETGLLSPALTSPMLQGIYLQPDPPFIFDGNLVTLLVRRQREIQPDLVQRLAKQLDIDNNAMTLMAPKGKRIQFGCSQRIRHTLSPENSSLTFATKGDLLNHWLCVLSFDLDRDWTWDALQDASFIITRTVHFTRDDKTETEKSEIGMIEVRHTATLEQLQNPERTSTRLIFIDAVDPKNPRTQTNPPSSELRFPDTIEVIYEIETRFKPGHGADHEALEPLHITLPITTPPAQIPQIASAGIALSPYHRNPEYSASEPRRRYLWVEFAEPIKDPQDGFFARVLAYAPDQLISNNEPDLFLTPEELPLPIDDEYIRVISQGASNDLAGLNAMQPMQKSKDSDRHYLLPLPPGLHADAAEMFGFFTYEFRVGHYRLPKVDDKANDKTKMVWSTAQGRFGRPLRAVGIQHPAPTLTCNVSHDEDKVSVTAPYAAAVFNGKNVTADPPRTQLWCLLYAQVKQADNKDFRNILLDDRPLDWRVRVETDKEVNWLTRYTDTQRLKLKQITVKNFRDDVDYAKFHHIYRLAEEEGVNQDATKYGLVVWTNDEIAQLLMLYGLPTDSHLSVVVVETLPTITKLVEHIPGLARGRTLSTLRDNMHIELHTDASALKQQYAQAEMVRDSQQGPSPVNDNLGNQRILRTSPLTPVPDVC